MGKEQKKKLTHYKNGQKTFEQKGDILTYYFNTGAIRAKGPSPQGKMQGKWIFNRKSGQLWGVGHFKDDKKHGLWLRYDKNGKEEYRETFYEGKQVKKK